MHEKNKMIYPEVPAAWLFSNSRLCWQ